MQLSNQTGDFAKNVALSFDGFFYSSLECSRKHPDQQSETYDPILCAEALQYQQEQCRDSATVPQLPSNAADFKID